MCQPANMGVQPIDRPDHPQESSSSREPAKTAVPAHECINGGCSGHSSSENPQIGVETSDPVLAIKNRRRRLGDFTTVLHPADKDEPVLEQVRSLMKIFECQFWPALKDMHANAAHRESNEDALNSCDETDAVIDENGWCRGCRRITGERYEVKVLGGFFLSLEGFETLGPALVDYAERHALKDERVQAMGGGDNIQGPVFTDWSIIISSDCNAQTTHIDVPPNNVQFGVILNDFNPIDPASFATPGTSTVLREDFGPHTIEDLFATVWQDAPSSMKNMMMNHSSIYEWISKVLDVFGPLFNDRGSLENAMDGAEVLKRCNPGMSDHLECGDMICTSGGTPHAGPKCQHFRMVMFGAASASSKDLYDVDDQFFAHSALLFVIQALWDHADHDSKAWLLRRLAQTAREYDGSIANKHDTTSLLLTSFMNAAIDLHSDDSLGPLIERFLEDFESLPQSELYSFCPPSLQATFSSPKHTK